MLSSLHLLSELTTDDLTDAKPSPGAENNVGGGGVGGDADNGENDGNLGDDALLTTATRKVDDAESPAAEAVVQPIGVASVRYDRHKPKWWKQRVGRYVTKPQRRALEAMQAYRLAKPPHGQTLDWESIFVSDRHPQRASPSAVWMELGFGKGDNLLCLAQRNPDTLFVGVEVHPSSIAICLQRIQQSLEQNEPWSEYELYQGSNDPFYVDSVQTQKGNPTESAVNVSGASAACELPAESDEPLPKGADSLPSPSGAEPYRNVRVYGGDGIVLLENGVSPGSLDVVLITFPDPFPSDKPHRILQVHTVNTIVQCLKPNGRLLLATDHPVFYDWAHDVVNEWNVSQQQQHYVQKRPRLDPLLSLNRHEWLPVVSRYERKGWEEGRRTLLAGWEKACG